MARARHPADDIAESIDRLERKVSANPDDAKLRHQLAVLLLSKHSWTYDPKLLAEARKHLMRSIEIRPNSARSHAVLGYLHDLSKRGSAKAIACFREAHRLDSRDRVVEVYVLTLLRDTGAEEEAMSGIEKAAPRHGVDLSALRREVIDSGLPLDAGTLLSAFLHARNFFKSALADEAERIQNELEPGRARRMAAAERKRCIKDQRELESSFDASRVPESVRALAPWASRYGVGDDICRPYLLKRMSKSQRAALIRDVDAHAQPIQAWLDSFGGKLMPVEAAAFMYLANGVEEIRDS